MHRRNVPSGFTLLELIIAITIAAGLLLAGRLLLERLGDTDGRLARDTAAADAAANADVLLRRLLLQVNQPSTDQPFDGGPHVARFTSWCDVPAGWEEACAVTLTLNATLTVHGSFTAPFVARQGMAGAEFRYLSNAADGGHWQRTWRSDVAVPLAIGIATPVDTIILRIGERG